MTVGSEFIEVLKRRDPRQSHFKYDQYQQLREIDSLDELRSTLHDWGYKKLSPDGDLKDLVRSFASEVKERRTRWERWGETLHTIESLWLPTVIVGVFLLPAYLVNRVVGERHALKPDPANFVGIAMLIVVLLAFEAFVSLSPSLGGAERPFAAGLLLAVVVGLGVSIARRNFSWSAVAVLLYLEFELIAWIISWWQS